MAIPFLSYAAEYDLQKGIDLSTRTSVSGALLNQMVDLATPGTNKGFIIRSATPPDTATYPRYTNFAWIDTTINVIKAWNGSDWVATAFGTNSVTGVAIAAGAVTAPKIASRTIAATNIAVSAITAAEIYPGTITKNEMGSASVGTDQLVAGAVNAAAITNGAVTSSKIAELNVNLTNMAANSVDGNKITNTSVNLPKLNPKDFNFGLYKGDGTKLSGTGLTCAHSGGTGLYAFTFDAPYATRNGTNYIPIVSHYWSGYSDTQSWITNMKTTGFEVMFVRPSIGISEPTFSIIVLDPQ